MPTKKQVNSWEKVRTLSKKQEFYVFCNPLTLLAKCFPHCQVYNPAVEYLSHVSHCIGHVWTKLKWPVVAQQFGIKNQCTNWIVFLAYSLHSMTTLTQLKKNLTFVRWISITAHRRLTELLISIGSARAYWKNKSGQGAQPPEARRSRQIEVTNIINSVKERKITFHQSS